MMLLSIIDYGSGNLHSARKAFERAAREAGILAQIAVTADADVVARSDRIVLPGVGAYADCRSGLDAVSGMVDALQTAVIDKARPFLGICVGQQLMASRGLEKQITHGLGWVAGDCSLITPQDASVKIPQIGWNTLDVENRHPLLEGIPLGPQGLHAYFVHSYHVVPQNAAERIATTDYSGKVTAMIGRDNMAGTQFHPEKSQKLGLALISNFLRWKP